MRSDFNKATDLGIGAARHLGGGAMQAGEQFAHNSCGQASLRQILDLADLFDGILIVVAIVVVGQI